MSSKPSKALLLPADYAQWLASLKSQISGARQRAVLSANREQIRLYHRIGSEILERQQRQGWGAKVIGRLSSDLQEAFPEMKGFSTSNLKYMRYFAEQWPTGLIGQQTADQLPWFHIVILLTKLSDHADREWYARQAIANGWPRVTLELHIKNRLRLRQGAAITNFESRLPAPHANLAHETLKDPYHFDFLGLGDEAHEREPSCPSNGGLENRSFVDGLHDLARHLVDVKQRAEALGIFTDDRELLACPNCGLLEDVMADGLLVTYPKDSVDLKDCGLRFCRVDETHFTCPKCGTSIKPVIL